MTKILSRSERVELYRKMLLARRAEEHIRDIYFQDEMKTPVHLGIGAEAIAMGVLSALPKGTKAFGTYRNHNIYLGITEDTDGFFAELFGKETGCAKGKAGSMHMSAPEQGLLLTSAVVATTIPVAVGAAFANRYQGDEAPSVVFFGDGAVEEGVFWESLNFASLHRLNVVFVCEDNELAIHTFRNQRQGYRSLRQAVEAFGCSCEEADGRDIEAVYAATARARETQARSPGPVVLHLDYFRFLQHVGPLEDFDQGYREKPELMDEENDPVRLYRNALVRDGVAPRELESVQAAIDAKIAASIEKARQAPYAGTDELYRDVYHEASR